MLKTPDWSVELIYEANHYYRSFYAAAVSTFSWCSTLLSRVLSCSYCTYKYYIPWFGSFMHAKCPLFTACTYTLKMCTDFFSLSSTYQLQTAFALLFTTTNSKNDHICTSLNCCCFHPSNLFEFKPWQLAGAILSIQLMRKLVTTTSISRNSM